MNPKGAAYLKMIHTVIYLFTPGQGREGGRGDPIVTAERSFIDEPPSSLSLFLSLSSPRIGIADLLLLFIQFINSLIRPRGGGCGRSDERTAPRNKDEEEGKRERGPNASMSSRGTLFRRNDSARLTTYL